VVGRWSGRLEYGYWYDLERRGEEYWVASNDPGLGADEAPDGVGLRRVVFTTGSHHEQMYWYELGVQRRLAILPMVYRIGDRKWFPFHGVVLKPSEGVPHAAARWNVGCVRCHTTDARPGVVVEDGRLTRFDTRASELGIACEACHGPAARHVARQRDPLERYVRHLADGRDDTIVNPARLDPRRAADVCGSCHSIHTSATRDGVRRFLEHGYRFQPGARLEDTRYIVRGEVRDDATAARLLAANPHAFEDRFWPDGKPSAGGREFNGTTLSPCYQRGDLHCGSCHAMHREPDDPRPLDAWADDQLGAGMRGNEACLQCHARLRDDVEAHTRHTADSPGSLCYACHMPSTTYGLLKQTRSHQIDSPSVAATLETGRENACNLCHLDRPLAWTAERLRSWYGIASPDLDADARATAEGVRQGLAGDAGQRIMIAWHMGQAPVRTASEGAWMVPVLAQLLEDPYAAVRYVAHASLRTFPGFEDFAYQHLAGPAQLRERHLAALERWEASMPPASRTAGAAFLITEGGALDRARFGQLLARRDDRRVLRNE
jgi:hypothetical protein